jgi:hypothetical protein
MKDYSDFQSNFENYEEKRQDNLYNPDVVDQSTYLLSETGKEQVFVYF